MKITAIEKLLTSGEFPLLNAAYPEKEKEKFLAELLKFFTLLNTEESNEDALWGKVNASHPFCSLERFCTISSSGHDEAMVLSRISSTAVLGKVMPTFYKHINSANTYQLTIKSFEEGEIKTILTLKAKLQGITENHETEEHFACFEFTSPDEEQREMLQGLIS